MQGRGHSKSGEGLQFLLQNKCIKSPSCTQPDTKCVWIGSTDTGDYVGKSQCLTLTLTLAPLAGKCRHYPQMNGLNTETVELNCFGFFFSMNYSIPSRHLFFLEVLAQSIARTSALLALLLVTKSASVFKNERLLTIFIGQAKQQESTWATSTASGGHWWVWLDQQTAQREQINCEF